ncbi:MAG: histidinol dehydrogenase [Pseudomonadota bacterium]
MGWRLNAADPDFEKAFTSLLEGKRETDEDVADQVAAIIAQVRSDGDQALLALTARFDRLEMAAPELRIASWEVEQAVASCTAADLAALEEAAARIEDYHARQQPEDLFYRDPAGLGLGWRWTAVQSVGLYVPGGLASYPSSVLMNAIPARVAGVERLVMVVPSPGGAINPLVLAAARLSGVTEIYRVGGAQAVAALAYGTESISPVDKIVGPGNAYVAAAKRQVFGKVGIDMIAGPSEILVVADGENNPAWIAADLLSQAEHDASAQSILITDDEAFAQEVDREVASLLTTLPRREIAGQSWRDHGAIILVDRLESAVPLVDRLAPEHLELAVAAPDVLVGQIRNAGAIFLGRHTPEALGDYVAGPNHVLPTARSARFSSGLSVLDFMKRSSLIACDEKGLAAIGRSGARLAHSEGLSAHAHSIEVRLGKNRDTSLN